MVRTRLSHSVPSSSQETHKLYAHGLRNELIASKLYYGDDCHKPFHHSCQLASTFLGVVPEQEDDNPSKADPEPIYGKVHLVAQLVGRTT